MAKPLSPDPELDAELLALFEAHKNEIDAASRDPRLEEIARLAEELVELELEPYKKVLSPAKLEDMRADGIQWVLLGPLRERLEGLAIKQQISGVVRKDGEPVKEEGGTGTGGGGA